MIVQDSPLLHEVSILGLVETKMSTGRPKAGPLPTGTHCLLSADKRAQKRNKITLQGLPAV